jgi:hypothetical protein
MHKILKHQILTTDAMMKCKTTVPTVLTMTWELVKVTTSVNIN